VSVCACKCKCACVCGCECECVCVCVCVCVIRLSAGKLKLYRRFGTVYRSQFQGSNVTTSVTDYQNKLRETTEEQKPRLHGGESLKYQKKYVFLHPQITVNVMS